MTPLKLGTITYDDLTFCQFQIKKSSIGRSVCYKGRYLNEQSPELRKESLKPGTVVTYLNGLIIMFKDKDPSTPLSTGLIENKLEYMNAIDSWKRHYLIVYEPEIIIVPKGDKLEDVENVGFLFHRDSDPTKCNCRLKRSRKTFTLCWVATKPIYPGNKLIGYYDPAKHKLFKSKKEALAAQFLTPVSNTVKLRSDIA